MTTPQEPARVDSAATTAALRVDLSGCLGNHCHRPRSPRQENSVNEDGVPFGCHRPAGWGTEHVGHGSCKLHGGNTQSGIVRASQEATEAVLTKYATSVDIDPAAALVEELKRSVGICRYLTGLASQLDDSELTYGLSEQITEPAIINADGESLTFRVTEKHKAGIHPLIELLGKERRHLREVVRDALAAGVSERMINLIEQTASEWGRMLDDVLDSLNLTDEQRAQVPTAVVRVLRSITGEGTNA